MDNENNQFNSLPTSIGFAPPVACQDNSNLPTVWVKICRILKELHPYVSKEIILQNVIVQMARMVTSKRVTYSESGKKGFPSWYSLILFESGGGKDRLYDDIEEYILPDFKHWYKYSFEEGEKDKSELPFELEDATQAGIYALGEELSTRKTGCIFIKHSELASYIKYGSKKDLKFLSDLCKLSDGKIPRTLTKSNGFTEEIKEQPTNVLLHTDYTYLVSDKTKNVTYSLFMSGLGRRFSISFQPPQEWVFTTFSDEQEIALRNELKNLGNELFNIFCNIPIASCYIVTPEAKNTLNNYKEKVKFTLNTTENDLLKREIKDRIHKAIKLANIIACFNHPTEIVIHSNDMEQAIMTVEFLSTGLKQFLNYSPESNDKDFKAFKFLENNIEKGYSKTALIAELCKHCGYTRRGLNAYFNNVGVNSFISNISDIANYYGYEFVIDSTRYSNGKYYYLKKCNNEQMMPNTVYVNDELQNQVDKF